MTKITAGRGKLDWRDLLKGLYVAVGTPVLTVIWDTIQAEGFTINWQHIGKIAAGAFIGYLIKQMSTPSQIVITDPIKVQAAKDGQTAIKL